MKRLILSLTLMVTMAVAAFAQDDVITGSVCDEQGEALIGATVMVKGTKQGVVTDINGNFKIADAAGKSLVFSYIGYESVTAKAKKGMKVKMKENAQLDEVVVTGTQVIDKRLFTGAATKIEAEKTKLDGVADVSRALEGRVAGVTVQNVSGTFGTAPKIRVRGATSIYGNSKPLWVIDGVILEDDVDINADDLSSGDAETLISNAIAGLNADDIESFTILKDGSATSIYGARAMAGVVVITTKRGKQGASTINYTGEFTYRMKPSYSNYNICNSQEQMGIYREMAAKGWLNFANLANASSSGVYGHMYNLIAQYDETKGEFGMPNTEAAMNAYLQEAEFRNTDWFDLLFKNTVMMNHSLSISTGSEKATLYGSLSYLRDPGWTIGDNVSRFTANMNAQFKLSDKVSLGILTNANFRKQNNPGTLSREVDEVSGAVNRSFDINPFSYALNTSRTMDPNSTYSRNYAAFNIFDELANNYLTTNVHELRFQLDLTVKPVKGLELKALGSYRTTTRLQEHFILNKSNMAEAYRAGVDNPSIMYSNRYLYTDPDKDNADPISVMPTGGIYLRTDRTAKQLDLRLSAQYVKVWGEDHILNLFGGMDLQSLESEKIYHSDYGVDYDNGRLVNVVPEFYKQAREEGTTLSSFDKGWSRGLAYYLSNTYSYQGKYTINLTGRYEGSNRLGRSTSSRWLPTWNVAGAWNIHEEGFFKRWAEKANNAISHATLRASYSLTADRGPGYISNATPLIYPGQIWRPQGDQVENVLALSNIANSELTYEKKHEFNVGVDVGFLNNRINMVFEAYWRNCYDLIGIIQTPGCGGYITKYANVATMKTHGVELTISSNNLSLQSPIKWTTDFTFSWNVDKITDLKSRSNMIDLCSGTSSSHFREGYSRSALFSIPFAGLNDQGIPQVVNQDGVVTTDDINFQEYEKLDNLIYEGPTEPPFTGGLNNMIKWKNLRLNIFLTYSFGNVIRLDRVFSAGYSDQSAMPKDFMNRWVESGDERYTDVPVIASYRQYANTYALSYAYNAYNYSNARVASGSFIRLKDISLTYDLPKKFLHKIGLNTASIKFDATNLWLIYADKKLNGQDPEFVNSGGVAMPMSKQFTMTLRLGI